MLDVTPAIQIADDELVEEFVRASGPGGQKVNKTSSAVQLRFDAARSPSLPEAVRFRLLALAGRRVTDAGEIVIVAQRYRSQEQNREDARDRLAALIRRAAEPPRPRKPTRPTQGAKRRRLDAKRQRSAIKRQRGAVDPHD